MEILGKSWENHRESNNCQLGIGQTIWGVIPKSYGWELGMTVDHHFLGADWWPENARNISGSNFYWSLKFRQYIYIYIIFPYVSFHLNSKFPYVPTFLYFKTSTNIIYIYNPIYTSIYCSFGWFSPSTTIQEMCHVPGAAGLERHLTRVASEAVWAAKRLGCHCHGLAELLCQRSPWRKHRWKWWGSLEKQPRCRQMLGWYMMIHDTYMMILEQKYV